MKALILAGGLGTRLSEETDLKPKPMVEIGGYPILWHIMKIYSHYGINDFIILTGYKSHIIKEYFINYYTRYSDITIDMAKNSVEIHKTRQEPWRVTLLYTGQKTMTGGRIKHAEAYLEKGETFCLTYGDGVANIDINKLIDFHKKNGKIATLTAVQQGGRFGALDIGSDNVINNFEEKPLNAGWVNGGFFVCDTRIFDYIGTSPDIIFERTPLETLAKDGQLSAYKHTGFWQAMDTLRDKNTLNEMWLKENAPWKVWK